MMVKSFLSYTKAFIIKHIRRIVISTTTHDQKGLMVRKMGENAKANLSLNLLLAIKLVWWFFLNTNYFDYPKKILNNLHSKQALLKLK